MILNEPAVPKGVSIMLSKEAQEFNELFKSIPVEPADVPRDYVKAREINAARPQFPIPDGVSITQIVINGIDGEVLRPARPNGRFIWYIHGGGLTTGAANERRDITVYLADRYGYTVYASNYRLSPENKWPAHLEDCILFYEGLLEQGIDPHKLFFFGESAGGTLVLSTALKARDTGLPLPAGLAAFSPPTAEGTEFPSRLANIGTDYMLHDALSRPDQLISVTGTADPPESLMKDPYFAPYYADYHDMPPIFLSASDYEVLYDDSVLLYEKLKQTGAEACLDVKHEMIHAWPAAGIMLPEAWDTISKAIAFLEK